MTIGIISELKGDIMILEISKEECDLLISLLTSAIAETKEEIYKTEKHEFKEELKSEKTIMEKVLARLIDFSNVGRQPFESIH